MNSFLFIGDPHIRPDNVTIVDKLIKKLSSLCAEKKPELIIIAGDILHTHEKLHTLALNKAYHLIDTLRQICPTYILVGNHDFISNQEFLSTNHWMNSLKKWPNVFIVDTVTEIRIESKQFLFAPYVPNGRFKEALDTIGSWKNATCIFCHQEIYGCKMGAIISSEGDKWNLEYPQLISGHIHSRQKPQANVYYSGTSIQQAFGENKKNIVAFITFNSKGCDIQEIDLELPRKKIIYMDVEDINSFNYKSSEDQIKITLKGTYEEFKAIKKTNKFKQLSKEKKIKIVFKPNIIDQKDDDIINTELSSFSIILRNLVMEKKDNFLRDAYNRIFV